MKESKEGLKGDLWVLKEGAPVVDAAPSSVDKRLVVVAPGATHRDLLPRLMDAQVGRVDETAQDEVREVGDKVVKGHPAEREETNFLLKNAFLKTEK